MRIFWVWVFKDKVHPQIFHWPVLPSKLTLYEMPSFGDIGCCDVYLFLAIMYETQSTTKPV